MHFKWKSKYKIDGLIAGSHQFNGDLKFNGCTRIEGHVKGSITSTDEDSILIVGETALIEGDIRAARVVINGKVTGNVYATQLLQLDDKAKVKGDLFYSLLEIHSGADIDGKVVKNVPKEAIPLVKSTEDKIVTRSGIKNI